MSIPRWVDVVSGDAVAAAMTRGLSGAFEAWGTLLTNAQAVLMSQSDRDLDEPFGSYEFAEWQPLIAASRILDLSASEHGLSDTEQRKHAAILAACAFGMSGTSVSATAVIRNHKLLEADLSIGEMVALAMSSPLVGREIFPRLTRELASKDCVEELLAFLAHGDPARLRLIRDLLDEVMHTARSAWEGMLLRLSRMSLDHAGRLATARVLAPYRSILPNQYLDGLVADAPLLLPSQFEAISSGKILDQTRNLIVTLPTGTGKTLLGELALLSSLGRSPGLVCYIAPYVALGRQVVERVSRHVPNDIRVHRLIGGYRAPVPLDPANRGEVLVATPERFDALLRMRPELFPTIRCVVFDEAHMLGNDQRGVRLEGIITRLRLAAVRSGTVPRFVLLSAVLSNVDALAEWLGIPSDGIVQGTWRPTTKRLLRWTEDGILRLHAGDDPMQHSPSRILGSTELPWPKSRFYQAKHYGSARQQEPDAIENIAFLADHQYRRLQEPILCVCSTRPKTRQLARALAARFVPIEPLPRSLRRAISFIEAKHGYLRPLAEALRRGIAYHNSSLSTELRERIEQAVEERTLKVVAATTTLAEGVDLPFRATILADWLTFDGNNPVPMERLLFKNISGRCGRAGQFTEGDTLIFDNPVGNTELTIPARRESVQTEIFFSPTSPELNSAITRLPVEAAVSAVGSQLLAAIAENPGVENLETEFVRNSFASRTPNAQLAARRIGTAIDEILDDDQGEPLAVAASPIELTAFGRAANLGGLSPSTARRLREVVAEVAGLGSDRDGLVEIGTQLLNALGDTPEQRNPDLRKALVRKNSRPVVRLDELSLVLDKWLSGSTIEEIFGDLPSNLRSTRRPDVRTWLGGVSEESNWSDQFAKFYDYIGTCVTTFLPWMLRSARPIAEMEGYIKKPWNEWASCFELGVDNSWAVQMLEDEAVSERTIALRVGRRLDVLGSARDLTEDDVRLVAAEEMPEGYENTEHVVSWFRTHGGLS